MSLGKGASSTDWTYENVPTLPDWPYRGFTGHELMEPFARINMNGRMPSTGTTCGNGCRVLKATTGTALSGTVARIRR